VAGTQSKDLRGGGKLSKRGKRVKKKDVQSLSYRNFLNQRLLVGEGGGEVIPLRV